MMAGVDICYPSGSQWRSPKTGKTYPIGSSNPGSTTLLPRPAESSTMAYYEHLSGSTLPARCDSAGPTRSVSFNTGTFEYSDFATGGGYYGWYSGVIQGIYGRGIDQTFFQMTPYTSTKASQVPVTNPPASDFQTNEFYTMRLGKQYNPTPTIKGFTVTCSPQGHQYHGFRCFEWTNGLVEDVKIKAFKGDEAREPGEIFPISSYRSTGITFNRVEADGTDANGVAVASAGIQNSFGGGMIFNDCYSHDTAYGSTFVQYETTDVTYNRCIARNANHNNFNFENLNGVVTMNSCQFYNAGWYHISLTNNHGSAQVTINDPKFDGPQLRLRLGPYMGQPSTQNASDIKLYVGGVLRMDLLNIIVTH